MTSLPIMNNSLMFAPMEGVTDEFYRNIIHQLYPQWDTYSCDFLKVPTTCAYPIKHVKKHFGLQTMTNKEQLQKTIYQILTAPNGLIKETATSIAKLGPTWLDLNLGCPSKTVCKNQGGAYLLDHLSELKFVLRQIRESFPYTFTCKIRVGFNDDFHFEQILKTIEDEGVDGIIIHGRTRKELYTGRANWDYMKRAVQLVDIPIIANGDIWNTKDIENCFDYTRCHSLMFGRSALKTPWLARQYKTKEKESIPVRVNEIYRYFRAFYEETNKQNLVEGSRIKRLKSVSRYIFDEIPSGDLYKKKFLLSKTFGEQLDVLSELREKYGIIN